MAKADRGLPPSFKLDIPDRAGPVQLGDYLDEVDAAPVARPLTTTVATPKPTPPRPAAPGDHPAPPRTEPDGPVDGESAPARADGPGPGVRPADAAAPESEAARQRRRRRTPKAPPRKQVNTTPETQRMIDEIIHYVQAYSVQRDAKASEIFHALVHTLHEALEELDLSNVPARGRWGTPTAQAFPISLKAAFKAAIAKSHRKNPR